MTGAGDNLIESTARALLRERIEATPWFRIRMSQEQRRAAIEREVDAYWHLSLPTRLSGCSGLAKRARTRSISRTEPTKKKRPTRERFKGAGPWGQNGAGGAY